MRTGARTADAGGGTEGITPPSRRPRVWCGSTGCRLNACESEEILERLLAAGAEPAASPSDSDIAVLTTCAVTARALAGSRKLARTLGRTAPGRVIVTGCASRFDPASFRACGSGVEIVPDPGEAAALLDGTGSCRGGFFEASSGGCSGRTRALLKIQDGCSHRCSYCMVPLARGESRSLDPSRVIERFTALLDRGCREIVLTGIDISSWGCDLEGRPGLGSLTASLLEKARGRARIRLGSLEPVSAFPGFLDGAVSGGICRHFHIALQSISGKVLDAMGRPGSGTAARRLLDYLHGTFEGCALGVDVMTGFPGEGDSEFDETRTFLEASPLAYLHVFPFSPRPGTPAADMGGRVAGRVAASRARVLAGIGRDKRSAFRQSRLGETCQAIVEGRRRNGYLIALTDNYIPLKAPEGAVEGDLVDVTLTGESLIWDE